MLQCLQSVFQLLMEEPNFLFLVPSQPLCYFQVVPQLCQSPSMLRWERGVMTSEIGINQTSNNVGKKRKKTYKAIKDTSTPAIHTQYSTVKNSIIFLPFSFCNDPTFISASGRPETRSSRVTCSSPTLAFNAATSSSKSPVVFFSFCLSVDHFSCSSDS